MSFTFPKTHARNFALFTEDVRAFFIGKNLFPAQTPALVVCPGMEPPLQPFAVEGAGFLPTSPELHLKKLLCRGYGDLFEIKTVFRQDMCSPHHQPEFQMLEWYRVNADLDKIEQDLKELIGYLQGKGWNGATLNLQNWSSRSMQDLFQEKLGFSLQPDTSHQQLKELSRQLEVGFISDDDTWDDTFFKIFLSRLEESFETEDFLILKDYPPSQAALAQLNKDGWADRRELYIRGIEVGNGFNELTDAKLQRKRFEADFNERKSRGLTLVPLDEEFLEHLENGMPPCAGIAVGLERLYMGLMGVRHIEELLEFPKGQD